MALTSEEKEQTTNKLLYLLSRHPADGMTIRQLQEQTGRDLSKDQITSLLDNSRHVFAPRAAKEGGSINAPPNLWKLTKYIPGSEGDGDLKRRIDLGSYN